MDRTAMDLAAMDRTASGGNNRSRSSGTGTVALVDEPAAPRRDQVTVAPATASSASRGLRIQGVPWRRWLTTTPGRLQIASVVIVVGLVLFAVATTLATEARSRAAGAVQGTSSPELVTAEQLYRNLADADTTASTIFLRAGQEPRELRSRYLDDITHAGAQLATIARSAHATAMSRQAVRTISEHLPAYAGLVESARANNAQGFPVGAAYLRQASATMHGQILPAATDLYRDAARQLRDNYEAGTSTSTFVVVLVAGVGMLGVLVGVQVYVTRRSNRVLNLGLVGASVIIVGLLGWTLLRFGATHEALHRAQERGSDSVELLASARILTLRAQNNENLALIERGTGDVYVAEFERLVDVLGGKDGTSGLLGAAAEIGDRTGDGDRIRALTPQFTELRQLHDEIRKQDDSGNYTNAVALAVGTNNTAGRELALVDGLQQGLQTQISRAHDRLASAAADAHRGFGVLEVAIPVFAVIAGLLALIGLEQRIAEYR